MADIDYFDSRVLTGVINKRPVRHDIFGNMFRRQAPRATELFELHVYSRGVSMLPSVTNAAGGTMRDGRELSAFAVKAPRFRPKRLFKAADLLKHGAGQTPYDLNVNPVERAIAEDMDDHRADIDAMVEIMCAQAIVHGKIDLFDSVEGQLVKTFTVDFKRPSAHTVVLTGTAQWSNDASDLQDSLQVYDEMIQEETNLGATDLYLGRKAYAAFRKHKDVRDDLDRNNINIGQLSPTIQSKFKGMWNGLRVWLVTGTYKDINGAVKHYLDPEYALLAAGDAQNVMEFGQPMDVDCSGPVEIFAKQFRQDDPSGIFTIAESRPLPWPKQPGATVLVKAVA
uniref:major capsid protein n=1 Tax=uncultured Bilophila sp. TaxID=529385 RepID=UPI0025DF51CA|nr:major capsid protein [uncultured Bilophila sp.]